MWSAIPAGHDNEPEPFVAAERPRRRLNATLCGIRDLHMLSAFDLAMSILFRVIWLGSWLTFSFFWYWYVGNYILDAHGVSGFNNSAIRVLLFVAIAIPSLVMGVLPFSVVEKKPFIVSFFINAQYRSQLPLCSFGQSQGFCKKAGELLGFEVQPNP
jgi:hypothetical protein